MRGWGGQVHATLQCNLAHTAGLLDARLGRRACEEGVGVGVQGCSMLDYSVLHHAVHNRQLGVVKVPPIESAGGGGGGMWGRHGASHRPPHAHCSTRAGWLGVVTVAPPSRRRKSRCSRAGCAHGPEQRSTCRKSARATTQVPESSAFSQVPTVKRLQSSVCADAGTAARPRRAEPLFWIRRSTPSETGSKEPTGSLGKAGFCL